MARRPSLSPRMRRLAVAGTTAAVALTPLATLAPSQAAPARAVSSAASPGCPPAFPVESLVQDQAVSVATVTRGTEVEAIPGTFVGVLEDAIAPGVDMILARLSSPVVDKAGIWQGMSGSPVTDPETGELIGAVSYALSAGPSTLAGITPAADMYRLLDTGAPAAPAPQVALPRKLAASLVEDGVVSAAQARRPIAPLKLPIGISGLSSARLAQLAPKIGLRDAHAAGSTSTEAIPVSAGSNVAVSMSHGLVTTAGVGTATALCGDRVLAFGHPMTYAGSTSMALHGARALAIQDDPTLSSFKLANVGAPIGTVDLDRTAGLRGRTGTVPSAVPITSTATEGAQRFSGTTRVTVPEMVPELALTTMVAAQDRVLDRGGKGAGVVSWTIAGRRRSGAPFTLTRTNRFADPSDISSAPAYGLAGDLMALVENEFEEVTITSITTSSRLDERYASWRLGSVSQRIAGAWVPLGRSGPVRLRPGATKHVRVQLVSRHSAPSYVLVPITAPRRSAGPGLVTLAGSWTPEGDFMEELMFESGDEDGEDGPAAPTSFPALLTSLRAEPRNDALVSSAMFAGRSARPSTRTITLDRVVEGHRQVRVTVR